MRLSHLPLPIAVITACFVLVNCSSRERDCTEPEIRAAGGVCTADTAGEGGTEGGTDGGFDVIAPPGCDLTKDPKDSPQCIDSAVGIFVSPTGDDSASGSKELPVRTIKRGLELASSKALPRVYVCEGTYDANVEITSPVSLYGGLSCAWAHTGAKPKIAPPKGVALRVTNASGGVLIADLEVDGTADTTVPGDSAIASVVSSSNNVLFRNATLRAGDAIPGATGATTTNYSAAAKAGVGANDGAGAVTCSCLDATTSSIGGKGGAIGAGGDPGSSVPAVGGINSGLGGAMCTPGTVGSNGIAKARGEAGTKPGALSASGWQSTSDATSGANGNPGQGGGGGGGRTGFAMGGGGACGGCGGGGGKPGQSGGSSFALLSFQSTVVIDGGELTSANAGAGGIGGAGQPGQGGGTGGIGACDGGPGGSGAGGSGGGGGAGGHSAPIAFVGSEPKVTGATLTPGTKGAAGGGGAAGLGPGNAGAAGAPGAEGKAQNTLAL